MGDGHRHVRVHPDRRRVSDLVAGKMAAVPGEFPSFRIWREMAGFSLPLLLDGLAERAREMFEQILVGRQLGTGDLGQYRYAYRIASMPSMAVIQICSYVLCSPRSPVFPADPLRFREAFLRALGWIWFAALPAGMLLVVAGEPIVVLLLGEQWRAAGTGDERDGQE